LGTRKSLEKMTLDERRKKNKREKEPPWLSCCNLKRKEKREGRRRGCDVKRKEEKEPKNNERSDE
jgi:hypothetical protein